MDAPTRLRTTVRRCTAVLVAAVGLTGLAVVRGSRGGETLVLLLVLGSLLYLVVEFVRHPSAGVEAGEEMSGSGRTDAADESQ